jgi:hypothetical protein
LVGKNHKNIKFEVSKADQTIAGIKALAHGKIVYSNQY